MQNDAQPNALAKKVETSAILPDSPRTGLPLDIVLSLLRTDELEKIRSYIAAYLGNHNDHEASHGHTSCHHAEERL